MTRLIVDANILARAAFSRRITQWFTTHATRVEFCTPEPCMTEAVRVVPVIAIGGGLSAEASLEAFHQSMTLVESVPPHRYRLFEFAARKRIEHRDPDDWPLIACALLFHCPIWTEDNDFCGSGIATWNTVTIPIYFSQAEQS